MPCIEYKRVVLKNIKSLLLCTAICTMFFACTSSEKFDAQENHPVGQSFAIPVSASGDIIYSENSTTIKPVEFTEIWAYVLDGRENTLSNAMPLTDVGYFGASISNQGKLTDVPNAKNIDFFTGRIHLVAVCNSYSMSHMMLNPEYPFREALINDLIEAVEEYDYDGLQIDYELVLASDKENYLSFLDELASRIKELPPTAKTEKRIFSVAVAARTRYLTEDAYDYNRITEIADSIFVMAYDEHWSNGAPGPVASFDWGKRVAEYAIEVIGTDKLVMGQPFYGRTWGDFNANRAYFHSGMERQIEENDVEKIERIDNILHYTYTIPLTVTAYFDDATSIEARSQMYKDMGINSTGFWCLGQEDPDVWQRLLISQGN